MNQVAVVGDENFGLGFRLAGVKRTFAVTGDAYHDKMEQLLEQDTELKIVITNQEQFEQLPQALKFDLETCVNPIFVILSETTKDETMRDKVKQSIGVDLLR